MTSEKLCPGCFKLRKRVCASVETVIVIDGIHEPCTNRMFVQEISSRRDDVKFRRDD